MIDSKVMNIPQMKILPVVIAGRCPQAADISPRLGSPQGSHTENLSLRAFQGILHHVGSGNATDCHD